MCRGEAFNVVPFALPPSGHLQGGGSFKGWSGAGTAGAGAFASGFSAGQINPRTAPCGAPAAPPDLSPMPISPSSLEVPFSFWFPTSTSAPPSHAMGGSSSSSTDGTARCPACAQPVPAGASTCGWCAPPALVSTLPPAAPRPYTTLAPPLSSHVLQEARCPPPGLGVVGPSSQLQGGGHYAPQPPVPALSESRFTSLWGPPSVWHDALLAPPQHDEHAQGSNFGSESSSNFSGSPTSTSTDTMAPMVVPTDWRTPGQGRPTLAHTPPPSPPSAGRGSKMAVKDGQYARGIAQGNNNGNGVGVGGDALRDLGLDGRVVDGLVEQGIVTPLPIQSAIIAAVHSGRDVLVAGPSGSGRTTAIGVALLSKVNLAHGPQALVISPTKDTAVETQRSIAAAGRYKRVKVHASFGGKSGDRAHIKSRKPQIVSATLGRALDNMKARGPIDASELHTLVVDDCDQMHRKFPTEMAQLFAMLPPHCQIVLVSAGVGKMTRDWANGVLRNPLKVDEPLVAAPGTGAGTPSPQFNLPAAFVMPASH